MKQFFQEVETILATDPGGRGILQFAPKVDIARLYAELRRAEGVLIVTGFPIRVRDDLFCCETDGPMGAADMAYAFAECGVRTAVLTDRTDYPQVHAAVENRSGKVINLCMAGSTPEEARQLFDGFAPSHIISIERPGKAKDGHFHTARGAVIDDMLSDTDLLFSYAREKGAVSIAIGDGGNELGTGALREDVAHFLAGGEEIAAVQAADYTLMTGVSNWWGWGIAALLSAMAGRDLMPSPAREEQLMEAAIGAGAVDGVTKKAEMTVDNLSLAQNFAVLQALRQALYAYFERAGVEYAPADA